MSSSSSHELLKQENNFNSSIGSLFKDLSVPAGLFCDKQTTYDNDANKTRVIVSFSADVAPCSLIDHLTNLALVKTNNNVTKKIKPKKGRKTRRKVDRSKTI